MNIVILDHRTPLWKIGHFFKNYGKNYGPGGDLGDGLLASFKLKKLKHPRMHPCFAAFPLLPSAAG